MSDMPACLAMARFYIGAAYPSGTLFAQLFGDYIHLQVPLDARGYGVYGERLLSAKDFDKFCETMEEEIDGFASRHRIRKLDTGDDPVGGS